MDYSDFLMHFGSPPGEKSGQRIAPIMVTRPVFRASGRSMLYPCSQVTVLGKSQP